MNTIPTTRFKRFRTVCDWCGKLIFEYQDTVYFDSQKLHYECWMKTKNSKS